MQTESGVTTTVKGQPLREFHHSSWRGIWLHEVVTPTDSSE